MRNIAKVPRLIFKCVGIEHLARQHCTLMWELILSLRFVLLHSVNFLDITFAVFMYIVGQGVMEIYKNIIYCDPRKSVFVENQRPPMLARQKDNRG